MRWRSTPTTGTQFVCGASVVRATLAARLECWGRGSSKPRDGRYTSIMSPTASRISGTCDSICGLRIVAVVFCPWSLSMTSWI